LGSENNVHIKQLGVSLSPAFFERQIAFLSRRYRIVRPSEFYRHVSDPGALAIHFDDGYRSIMDVTLPILEKYGCPFKIHLNSAIVTGQISWLNKLSAIISILSETELQSFAEEALPINKNFKAHKVYDYWNHFIMRITPKVIDEAYDRLGCSDETRVGIFLNEEDVCRLRDHELIEWGSHGKHHYPLDKLSRREMEEEVVGGHADLKKLLGDRLDGYSIGFGTPKFRTPRIADVVSKVDKYFVSTTCGTHHLQKVGTLDEIQRIAVEPKVAVLAEIFKDARWWFDETPDVHV